MNEAKKYWCFNCNSECQINIIKEGEDEEYQCTKCKNTFIEEISKEDNPQNFHVEQTQTQNQNHINNPQNNLPVNSINISIESMNSINIDDIMNNNDNNNDTNNQNENHPPQDQYGMNDTLLFLPSTVNYVTRNNNNNNQNLNNPSNNFGNSFNLSLVSQKDVCSEHGEPISYLCMDCMSKCICSECIVHGIHKTHEVITIKKAYPLIYNKTNELINYVQDKIKEINITNGNLEKKKIDIANINDKVKNDIKNAFEEIRIKLGMKEKEIIEKSESTLMDNIQEINTYGRILQSKAISLNKIIETLNAYLMRKDELLLINFYVENKNKILNQSEVNELNKIPELENLSNLRIDLDKSSFDIMINALNNLHFEINTMKGFNYNLNYDTQKFLAQRNLYGFAYKNNISEENPLNFTNNFNNSSQQINNNNNNNLNEENNLNESNNNINNNNNNNSNV